MGDGAGTDIDQHAIGGNQGALFPGEGHQQKEFLAAVAIQFVGVASALIEDIGNLFEDEVPRRMAIVVVVSLEVIDIDQCQCIASVFPRSNRRGVGHIHLHRASIRQAREGILDGEYT